MKILFDTRRLSGPQTGLHRVVSSILKETATSKHEWHSHKQSQETKTLSYLIKEIPFNASNENYDLVFSPHFWDFPGRCHCPIVTIVHDIWPLLHPDWKSPHTYRHLGLAPCPRRASGIIFISEFSKKSFFDLYPSCSAQTRVIHIGCTETPSSTDRPEGLPDSPFFLSVVSNDPRKNIGFLEALAPKLPLPLVIAGNIPEGTLDSAIKLGALSDNYLGYLYKNAFALLFPSIHEGFGLPPVEAGRAGTPSLVANTSSLPEVMGEDYQCILPLDIDVWAAKANELRDKEAAYNNLCEYVRTRSSLYTWEKFYEEAEQFIEDVFKKSSL